MTIGFSYVRKSFTGTVVTYIIHTYIQTCVHVMYIFTGIKIGKSYINRGVTAAN